MKLGFCFLQVSRRMSSGRNPGMACPGAFQISRSTLQLLVGNCKNTKSVERMLKGLLVADNARNDEEISTLARSIMQPAALNSKVKILFDQLALWFPNMDSSREEAEHALSGGGGGGGSASASGSGSETTVVELTSDQSAVLDSVTSLMDACDNGRTPGKLLYGDVLRETGVATEDTYRMLATANAVSMFLTPAKRDTLSKRMIAAFDRKFTDFATQRVARMSLVAIKDATATDEPEVLAQCTAALRSLDSTILRTIGSLAYNALAVVCDRRSMQSVVAHSGLDLVLKK